jgi:hypothetical protein
MERALSQKAGIFPVKRTWSIALEATWVVEENGEQACLNCGQFFPVKRRLVDN